MCYSASVSYTAAALLLPAGLYCLHHTRRSSRAYWLVAIFPIFFAIQQAIEGRLWQVLDAAGNEEVWHLALGFYFFSHFFWLIWVPLSSLRLEAETRRRELFRLLLLLGAIIGLTTYLPLYLHANSLSAEVLNHSIVYRVGLEHEGTLPQAVQRTLYAAVVLLPLLYSSHKPLRVLGVLLAFSMLISVALFEYAFVSVWCFFAAVLSLYLIIAVRQWHPVGRGGISAGYLRW